MATASLTIRHRIPCLSNAPQRLRGRWKIVRYPPSALPEMLPRYPVQRHCDGATVAPLQYSCPMLWRSNRPPCSRANLAVTPSGVSSFAVPVRDLADTLNAAIRVVIRPVPRTLRCRRGMAKSQVPHRLNFAQSPRRLCPAGNCREPVSSMTLKYAARANGHAPVKTSHHTQRAVVTTGPTPGYARGTLEPP